MFYFKSPKSEIIQGEGPQPRYHLPCTREAVRHGCEQTSQAWGLPSVGLQHLMDTKAMEGGPRKGGLMGCGGPSHAQRHLSPGSGGAPANQCQGKMGGQVRGLSDMSQPHGPEGGEAGGGTRKGRRSSRKVLHGQEVP